MLLLDKIILILQTGLALFQKLLEVVLLKLLEVQGQLLFFLQEVELAL
jgi:hypothetical protein